MFKSFHFPGDGNTTLERWNHIKTDPGKIWRGQTNNPHIRRALMPCNILKDVEESLLFNL